jgi:N-methylhydantoinase B
MEVVGGGWGAMAEADGADVVDSYVGNCSNVPVESLEIDYPFMRIEEYALRRGSAGAGRRRGGLGVRRLYRVLEDEVSFNCYSDRFRIAPWGLFGGRPGAKTRFVVARDGQEIDLPSKVNFALRKGDLLIIETAGGGGYGDPREREPDRIERDLKSGLITPAQAHDEYGV